MRLSQGKAPAKDRSCGTMTWYAITKEFREDAEKVDHQNRLREKEHQACIAELKEEIAQQQEVITGQENLLKVKQSQIDHTRMERAKNA